MLHDRKFTGPSGVWGEAPIWLFIVDVFTFNTFSHTSVLLFLWLNFEVGWIRQFGGMWEIYLSVVVESTPRSYVTCFKASLESMESAPQSYWNLLPSCICSECQSLGICGTVLRLRRSPCCGAGQRLVHMWTWRSPHPNPPTRRTSRFAARTLGGYFSEAEMEMWHDVRICRAVMPIQDN